MFPGPPCITSCQSSLYFLPLYCTVLLVERHLNVKYPLLIDNLILSMNQDSYCRHRLEVRRSRAVCYLSLKNGEVISLIHLGNTLRAWSFQRRHRIGECFHRLHRCCKSNSLYCLMMDLVNQFLTIKSH